MTKMILHNTKRMARPKTGRKTFPNSIALTLEEIEFLHTVPNASELIRSILDDIINNQEDIEKKLPILSLKHQIDNLQKDYVKNRKEREEYWIDHHTEMFHDGGMIGEVMLNTEEARYHNKILETLDDAMLAIASKINKLKTQIMTNEETQTK